jgi:chromate transporter
MNDEATARPAPPRFAEALRLWFTLGCIGFGGPAGQIALMHSELVERRRWISEGRFLHALNYCMVLPGPEAQQLATYLGWLLHRRWGGIVAGALFVLPSLLLLVALGHVYMRFGQVAAVAGVFDGLKPAVVALVLHAAVRIGSRTLKTPWAWGTALLAFVAMAVLALPFPLIVIVAGLVGWWVSRSRPMAFATAPSHGAAKAGFGPALIDDDTPPPAHAAFSRAGLLRVVAVGLLLWALTMALLVLALGGWQGLLAQMGLFFSKAALVTFGGAYAVLPYVVQGAVEQHGWVTAAQSIDALALGETTPGPLIMVVAFIAFIGGWQAPVFGPEALFASAATAAVVVTWFTFLPSFIFILAGGPLVEATRGKLGFTAPLAAISAAVVGVIADLALFFAGHVFWPQGSFALTPVLIALGAAVALIRFKLGVLPVLLVCAGIGLVMALLA